MARTISLTVTTAIDTQSTLYPESQLSRYPHQHTAEPTNHKFIMAPKKKAQKMALTEFFADASSGSWADELIDLPTAPAARDSSGPKRGEPGYLDSMPDRGDRSSSFTGGPPREELPLPTVPPYTAFVGNLTFETDEEALREFFGDLTPTSVRLVKDQMTSRPKGFGYVEFPSQDKLRDALSRSNSQLQGRSVRISVAEAPSSRPGFAPSAAETADQWRRSGPLPSREAAPMPGARRQPSFNNAEPGPERDWSAARGSRFTPSAPSAGAGGAAGFRNDAPRGDRFESRADRFAAPLEPSQADEVDQWRSSKPMVEPRSTSQRGFQRENPVASGQSSPGLADTEQTWSRGTKLKTPVLEQPARAETSTPASEEREWRGSKPSSAVASTDGESPRLAAPVERRKLALAPRSVPATPTAGSAEPSENGSTAPSSNSIFGSAKPIDTAAREREAEERLQARNEERKKAREEESKRQKEEADKGRQLADEKAKMIKDAQEKARLEAMGVPANAANGAARAPAPGAPRGRGGPPATRGRGAWGANPGAPGGPQRKSSSDTKAKPVVTEDGFEGVTKGAKRAEVDPAPKPKKDTTTRQGFSFAAAAGRVGVVEDEEDREDVPTIAAPVDEVTNGVKEVSVE